MIEQQPPGQIVQEAVAQGLIGASQAALEAQTAITSGVEQNDSREGALDDRELALNQKKTRVQNEFAQFDAARSRFRVTRSGPFWEFLFNHSSQDPPELPALPGTEPDGDDNLVYQDLLEGEQEAAADAQGRAKQWLAGITALIGLIATASVLTAPDVGDLTATQLGWSAVLAFLGFLALVVSLLFSYGAAYGDPGDQALIERGVQSDMRLKVTRLRKDVARTSRARLTRGVVLAVIGILLVLAGTVVTWLPVSKKDDAKTSSVCVKVGDKQIVKISGGGLTISALDGAAAGTC